MKKITAFIVLLSISLFNTGWTKDFPAGHDHEVYFFVPGVELSYAEMLNTAHFKKHHSGVLNLGMQPNSIWLKLIFPPSEDNCLLLSFRNPTFQEVELFPEGFKDSSVLISEKRTFHNRAFYDPDYIFEVLTKEDRQQVYYVRINSYLPLVVPIALNSPDSELSQSIQKITVSGIYAGVILIMFFYNLFIYLSTRSRSYLFYVFYILFLGLTQLSLDGFGFMFLWPEHPSIEMNSLNVFASASGIFALLFAQRFLLVKIYAPRINILFNILALIFAISIVFNVLHYHFISFVIMQLNTMISSIFGFMVSLYIIRKGYYPARFFFFAWSFMLLGSIIYILKDYDIFPLNDFTNFSVKLGSTIEIALLSFGLANRMNLMKKERDLSREIALETSRKNEKLIKEQNILLEKRVNERTAELQVSNQILGETLENLKGAQMQLVNAEKMSSLGLLTAGIAHEINNPINFVTSNIKPLERDVNILFEVISDMEEIALKDFPQNLKKEEIEELKRNKELDYLNKEIKLLINGIKDGAFRTATIVKGLKTFSRSDGDVLKLADINEAITATLVIVNNLLGNIDVEKKFGDIPRIQCYAGKLNQAFLNIITNALYAIERKFKGAKGGKLQITTKEDSGYLDVVFWDNGIGMTAAVKENIFNPFFTTKDVGEGTGLGMSITFSIIEQHKGEILIKSEEGIGTTLTLKIPII